MILNHNDAMVHGQDAATMVFDVPETALHPRLLVTEGEHLWPDRLFELFLVGDEKSMLHKKTTFALTGSGTGDWGLGAGGKPGTPSP